MAGHRRYAHIAAMCGDAVAAQALGMNKDVSEDALRRALELMLQGAMPRETDFKQTLCADMEGFSLHAAVRCDADC